MNLNNWLSQGDIIVLKTGSDVMTCNSGLLDLGAIKNIALLIASLRKKGYSVIWVASGAIKLGCRWIEGFDRGDNTHAAAAAAVGQRRLMDRLAMIFGDIGNIEVAQFLLDSEAFAHPRDFTQVIRCVLQNGIIPVLNENDPVTRVEIDALKRGGDNDVLAADAALALQAKLVVYFTNVAGFLRDGEVIGELSGYKQIMAAARSCHSHSISNGGMQSKLISAARLTKAGIPAIIAKGKDSDGEAVCTALSCLNLPIGTLCWLGPTHPAQSD